MVCFLLCLGRCAVHAPTHPLAPHSNVWISWYGLIQQCQIGPFGYMLQCQTFSVFFTEWLGRHMTNPSTVCIVLRTQAMAGWDAQRQAAQLSRWVSFQAGLGVLCGCSQGSVGRGRRRRRPRREGVMAISLEGVDCVEGGSSQSWRRGRSEW